MCRASIELAERAKIDDSYMEISRRRFDEI